jgi:hypothetical protein
MAYDTQKLFKKALIDIGKYKCVFYDDVAAFLGIAISTFYEHFPKESKEYKEISLALDENKAKIKTGLRTKWYQGDNATSQIALYKIIGTEDEAHRLNGSKQVLQGDSENPLFLPIQIIKPNNENS